MTIVALALGTLLSTASPHADEKEGFKPLTVDEVATLIEKKEADIFDNNGADRFAQSHLPTAKWVAFQNVKEADLPKDKSRNLVFYCTNEH